jgi:hypothetical protein
MTLLRRASKKGALRREANRWFVNRNFDFSEFDVETVYKSALKENGEIAEALVGYLLNSEGQGISGSPARLVEAR